MDTSKIDYKKEFIEKLQNVYLSEPKRLKETYAYNPSRPIKLGGSLYVSSSGLYETQDLRSTFINHFFNEIIVYDIDLLNKNTKESKSKKTGEEEFLGFKFLNDIFDQIDVLYFMEFYSDSEFICFFKFKNIDSCIFELFSRASSSSGTTISFDYLGNQTGSVLKQSIYSTLFCYTQNCFSYYSLKEAIEKSLDFKNPKYYTAKEIKNSICLLSAVPGGGFRKSKYEIEHVGEDCIEFYDNEIQEKSDIIIDLIQTRNKGMMLFHGDKGCGKTTFIKYIISNSQKNFYYINGEAAASFSSSSFLEFIALNSKNSVFIFEDMEHLIVSRENKTNSVISDILNASDGILSDILSPIFIFTFNTNINNIDSAFLRPGRLIIEQEFKKLSYENAKAVAKKVKVKLDEEKEYSLAEIFEKKNLPKNVSARSKKFSTEKNHVIKGFAN